MKKIGFIIGALLLLVGVFAGGLLAGWYFSDYDVLCGDEFNAHKLQKEFKSQSGITLPEGTVVVMRGCKPYIQGRLEFRTDNWYNQHTEKLNHEPSPTYDLYVESIE